MLRRLGVRCGDASCDTRGWVSGSPALCTSSFSSWDFFHIVCLVWNASQIHLTTKLPSVNPRMPSNLFVTPLNWLPVFSELWPHWLTWSKADLERKHFPLKLEWSVLVMMHVCAALFASGSSPSSNLCRYRDIYIVLLVFGEGAFGNC